jgi:predicted amidohydrolase
MTKTVRIALLQLPAFSMETAAEGLAHALRRIDEAATEHRPDLIALPEVTYPAYFLGTEDLSVCGVLSPAEAADAFAQKSRDHGVYIAVGLALDAHGDEVTVDGQRYANGALLFGRDGEVVGRYDKSFLWHFDNRWFAAGDAYPVFETDIGRIGMLVCADGRMPEIARCLTLGGAQIILDLTAWVSTGRTPEELTTTQVTHLMRTRAAENGVWIACCDKFGLEAESIVYAGRSCFINPRGEIVAALGPEEDASLVYDVPIEDARTHVVRRPELYEVLGYPTESLPVMRTLDEQFVPGEEERRIAVVQMTMPVTGEEFVATARHHVERQGLMDASVVVFPATPSRYRNTYEYEAMREAMTGLASKTGVWVTFVVWDPDGEGYRTMYLAGPSGIAGEVRQTHKPPGEKFAAMPLGDDGCPIVTTPFGRVGMMIAADGYVPEVARSMMLRGAEIILWASDDPGIEMQQVARTRAEENRVFVASAAAPTATGASLVADPNGRVLAVALEGQELAVGAEVNRALSHIKERAPGTHVVRGRRPESYGIITRVGAAAGAGRDT